MKKALYYALRPSYQSFAVVAITREKSRHWYGRTVEGIGTHGRLSELTGRFDTAEAAIRKADGVADIYRAYKPQIDAAQRKMQEVITSRADAIKAWLED